MLTKNIPTLALFAIASQVLAEPVPYQPAKMMMSVQDLFGVSRRQDGYQPTQSLCGTGTTCAQACGVGFEQCASSDKQIHCFNSAKAQICCSDGTGNSCDAGYYCTQDDRHQTWCCPNGMDLQTCAKAYKVSGVLHSETPAATNAAASSTSKSGSSTSVTSAASYTSHSSTTTLPAGTTAKTSSTAAGNSTKATGSPTASTVSVNGASVTGPAVALSVIFAAALAALL